MQPEQKRRLIFVSDFAYIYIPQKLRKHEKRSTQFLLIALLFFLNLTPQSSHGQLSAAMDWLQELAESPRMIGPRIGTNFATQFGDTYSGLGFRVAPVIGGFMKVDINEKFAAQAELNISLEGARNRNLDFSEFSTVIYDQRLKYNYLQMPLMVKYTLDNGVIVTGALQVGIKLAAKETRIIRSGEPDPTDMSAGTRNFTNRIKSLYPTVVFGAEYPIPYVEGLNAQARFQTSIFDNVRRFAGDSEGTYPLLFQLALSYDLYEMEP